MEMKGICKPRRKPPFGGDTRADEALEGHKSERDGHSRLPWSYLGPCFDHLEPPWNVSVYCPRRSRLCHQVLYA
jgi:hypothetical protein